MLKTVRKLKISKPNGMLCKVDRCDARSELSWRPDHSLCLYGQRAAYTNVERQLFSEPDRPLSTQNRLYPNHPSRTIRSR